MTTTATARCDSVSPAGQRLLSIECEYPASCHAELLSYPDLVVTTAGHHYCSSVTEKKRSLVTATEWDNFFNDRGASIDLDDLKTKIKKATDASTPKMLEFGDWHLPYIDSLTLEDLYMHFVGDGPCDADKLLALCEQAAVKISTVRCINVSGYTGNPKVGVNVELQIFDTFLKPHEPLGTGLSHQAQPRLRGETPFRGWRTFREQFVNGGCISGRYTDKVEAKLDWRTIPAAMRDGSGIAMPQPHRLSA